MPRIPDQDRLGVVDAHIGHWQQADAQQGTPIEIVAAYGVAQLQTDREAFHDKQEEIAQLESDLAAARAERDGIFGLSPDDDGGAWFRLRQYKSFVRARLGARHPLSRTVPNLGRVRIESYVDILHRFIDHWERVNAQLTPELTLGTYTLANLQTAHDDLLTRMAAIQQLESAQLPLAREEREQLFGDEAEDEREQTSIIARLTLYHATIEAMFPNQPLADSLPDIYATGGSTTLPTFRFNWSEDPGVGITTWLENPGIASATDIFLKEGVVEQTQPFDPDAGNIIDHTWADVAVVDDLDQLDLLDASGATVARGAFDASLQQPGS